MGRGDIKPRRQSNMSNSTISLSSEDILLDVQGPNEPQRLVIDIPNVEVELTQGARALDDDELKKLVWDTHKKQIYEAMKIREVDVDDETKIGPASSKSGSDTNNKLELEKANQRLFLLDQISEVQRQFLQKKEPRAVFGYLLTGLLDLMDSEYGFIGQIKYEDDGTMYLQTHAITNIAWNQATRQFYEDNALAGLKFYNLDSLFGHVMVNAVPVVANKPGEDNRACGIPEGHPPLNHFLGIPFFEPGGKQMNGMVGIANRPGGYSKEDIEFLEPFTVTCSNLIQAYGAMQENIRLIDTLEDNVKKRTFELEQANIRLEKANRRVVEASQAQLLTFASMSHELRTPLNCIVGLSSLMLETDLTPQQNDSMRMIVTSGELLSAIVNDVLDYSKLISGNVEIDVQPTDLQATLDAVVHSIEVKALDRNLRLRTNYDSHIPTIVDTDGRRLQQILYNLLGNALKFSKDNGEVELTIQLHDSLQCPTKRTSTTIVNSDTSAERQQSTMPTHENAQESCPVTVEGGPPSKCPFHKPNKTPQTRDDDSTISSVETSETFGNKFPIARAQHTHDNSEEKKFLRFIVKDYGKGIEKGNFEKIFKPFMQASGETEKIYGGTGLGLAITSKLVEALGGVISVDSEIGGWSEFTVDIPFSRAAADVDTLSKGLSDTRIMIVNENKEVGLSTALIETYDLNIVEFETCQELSVLAKVKGAIDRSRVYLCLVHEDLYDHDSLLSFACAAPGTTVLTFGPNYTVKDSFSKGHYRSLAHLLPSSFVNSLIQSKANNDVSVKSAEASPSDTPDYGSLRVLMAEDNAINQKVLKNMLKRVGIENVDVVDNGKKAVDAAAKFNYDIILMDMQMPVMDGVEATKIIVQQDHAKKQNVVFVTANAMESFEKQARDAGAIGFIAKPFNLKKIESFLASFFSGKDFLKVA